MTFAPIRLWRRVFYLTGPAPRHVDIEISTRCNLNCLMCRRQTIDYGDRHMDYALYRHVIDNLPAGVELVSLGGYGEMMLHPRFFDMLGHAHARGFRTQTTSNGTLLHSPGKIRKLLDTGLDRLHVSLDYVRPPEAAAPLGHPYSPRVLRNLERLADARRARPGALSVGINCVVHGDNFAQLDEVVGFAAHIGLDFIELLPMDDNENLATAFRIPGDAPAYYRELKRRHAAIRVVTPLDRFPSWRRIFHLGHPFCHFRQQTLHVGITGKVSLCPYGFSNHALGDVHHTSLDEIWRAPELAAIRKNPLNPVCANCRIFKQADK